MTNHTPGPWQRSGVRHKLGDEDCLQVGPDGFTIAFLPIGRRPNEQAGAIADARLIAAAPDMLEALRIDQILYSVGYNRAAAEQIGDGARTAYAFGGSVGLREYGLKIRRAAIAKAVGSENAASDPESKR